MLFHTVTFTLILALCTAVQYGKKGKLARSRYNVLCSGAPIGDLRQDQFELNGRWYNKFFKENLGTQSNRPNNVTVDFTVAKNSNRAQEIVMGNDPNTGGCLVWTFRDFQIFDNKPCVAEKGTSPETCADEEWVHLVFGKNRKMLFFYYCADENPRPRCQRSFARCLSRTPYISREDIRDCQDLFTRFNLGPLPEEDRGSANNACSDRSKTHGGTYTHGTW